MATERKAASTPVVFAELVVVANDDPRHAVIAEQQLSALAALVPAAGEAGIGSGGADGHQRGGGA